MANYRIIHSSETKELVRRRLKILKSRDKWALFRLVADNRTKTALKVMRVFDMEIDDKASPVTVRSKLLE